ALVRLGSGDETTVAALPHHLVIDRCYVHGHPNEPGKNGILLNSAHTAIIDSYISDWKEDGTENHGIAGWNGPGPYKIQNNYVEAAGINLIIGGGDPKIQNQVPSDIEIRGNHFAKPLAWMATAWDVKN